MFSDLPVLKLRKAQQQKHQPVDKIRAKQIRPTINSRPEEECRSRGRGVNRAKLSPAPKALYRDEGCTN
jgi:hypothetical protein